MRTLRSTWGSRLIAALLALSLSPGFAVPVAQAAQHVAERTYADWLRAQLSGSPPPAFEAALEAAVAVQPVSFEAFLDAFVEAYQAQPTDVSLDAVFSVREMSGEALVYFLHGRFQQVMGVALPPRAMLTVAGPQTAGSLSGPNLVASFLVGAATLHPASTPLSGDEGRTGAVLPLRLLSAAQPLGP